MVKRKRETSGHGSWWVQGNFQNISGNIRLKYIFLNVATPRALHAY